MSEHTHFGDGTVPGLHGEPILTPTLGCLACAEAMERRGISTGGDLSELAPASGISYTASIREKLRYDMDEGRLITESYPDGVIRHAIEIRKGLEDALVLQAIVIELERRGYTVTPPA